jgi:hypothetical protein
MMKSVVKFLVVLDNELEESFEMYMLEFAEYLFSKKLIEEKDTPQFFSLEEVPLYLIEYDYGDCEWRIGVLFGTYEHSYQIEVGLESDNYEINIEDDYLEKLKISVKDYIKTRFPCKKIYWLFDSESENFASKLYPKIFKVENLIREIIVTVLSKKFGSHWWNLVDDKIRKKYDARIGEYKRMVEHFKDIDGSLLSIDTGDLIKILEMKIKIWEDTKENREELRNLLVEPNLKIKDLTDKIENQQKTKHDYWNDIFVQLLQEGFIEKIKDFENYRNHIAHNKYIDKMSYKRILELITDIENKLNIAKSKIPQIIPSKEEITDDKFKQIDVVLNNDWE